MAISLMRLLFIFPFLSSICAQAATTVIDLGYAKYEGSLNDKTGNVEFLGVRYAAAPTGSGRWREPRAPEATPGVQKANAFPNRCWEAGVGSQPTSPFPLDSGLVDNTVQAPYKLRVPGFSEDCLFLNVITPGSGEKDLPVVVWIHGGGYMAGSASGFFGTDIFDGNDLVRQAGGGVVAVVLQYRIGLFGFLAGQKIHDDGALNAGLLDQQFALQWVQQHISKFGGDPRKVAIWGISAGAGSVLQHVVANNGNTQPPLFRGAITSSTFVPSQYHFNDRIPEQLYAEVVRATGCSSARCALCCLRDVDINLLQDANIKLGDSSFYGVFTFVPVVDGRLIAKRPTQLLREGRLNGEALLAFTNTVEGAVFVNKSTAPTVQVPEYVANLFPKFRNREVSAAVAQYANLGTPISQVIAIMGESIFTCPTYYLLRAWKKKMFKGFFAVPPADHGDDTAYYFPSHTTTPYNNTEFINNFAQSFQNFVMALDPNVKWDPANTVPQWTIWNQREMTEMLFNRTDAGDPIFRSTTTDQALFERCSFWESVGALTGQ